MKKKRTTKKKPRGRVKVYLSRRTFSDRLTRVRLRLIYPSGRVRYETVTNDSGGRRLYEGCTSRRTQRAAIAAARQYAELSRETFEYLGEV